MTIQSQNNQRPQMIYLMSTNPIWFVKVLRDPKLSLLTLKKGTECFNIIDGTTEISKKPKFIAKDDNNFSSYDQALALHNYTMIKMKQPREEQKDRNIIK